MIQNRQGFDWLVIRMRNRYTVVFTFVFIVILGFDNVKSNGNLQN